MPVAINNCHIYGNLASGSAMGQVDSVPMCESVVKVGAATAGTSCANANWMSLSGGGIFIRRGDVTISSSVIELNAGGFGGAVHIAGGDVTISDSTLSANTAEFGGAIDDTRALYHRNTYYKFKMRLPDSSTQQSLTVRGCRLLGNTARKSAGAIRLGCSQVSSIGGTTMQVKQCKAAHTRLIGNEVRGNQAGESGGAIMLYYLAGAGAYLESNIFEGNAAPVESVFKVNPDVVGEAYNTTFLNNLYASLAPANDGEEVAAAGTMVNVRSANFIFRCVLGRYMDATPFVMTPQDLEGCKRCPRGVYGDSPTLRGPECSGTCPPGHYCNAERLSDPKSHSLSLTCHTLERRALR